MRRLDLPASWRTKPGATRDDLDRLRRLLEQLNRRLDGLGAGSIQSITSADGSIVVTNPVGPAVDLSWVEPELVGTPASNFWAYPETADPEDLEFDTSTLPAGFTLWNVTTGASATPATGVSLTSAPAANTCRITAHHARKRSWLLFQPSLDAVVWFYGKQITMPGDTFSYRSRLMSWNRWGAPFGPANNQGTIQLTIIADDGGTPYFNAGGLNYVVHIGIENDGGTLQVEGSWYTTGAATSLGLSNDQDLLLPSDVEVELVHEAPTVNTTFSVHVRTPFVTRPLIPAGGNPNFGGVGSGSNPLRPGQPAWIGWYLVGTTSVVTPGIPAIVGADYLRKDSYYFV